MNKGLWLGLSTLTLPTLNTITTAATGTITTGPDGDAFYNPPTSLKSGKHGDLIWVREIPAGVPHAKAWKILYWSTTINNELVPVSGMVIAPDSTAKSLRPVVTWGHGTTGVPRNCAPSQVKNPAQDAKFYFFADSSADYDYGVPALSKMIAAGYVVTATDYNGLGGPGIHQYLIGQTEARNMLDAAIAAQQIKEVNAGKNIVSIGWSQGGQASGWTAQIPDYLGDRGKLLGAVTLAPVNALEEFKIIEKKAAAGEKLRATSVAERMMGWYAMTVVFPELKLDDVLTPVGLQYWKTAYNAHQCSHHMSDSLGYAETYQGTTDRKDPTNRDAWLKRYEENSLASVPVKTPVAVYQGDADLSIFPAASEAYVKKVCSTGSPITYTLYKGVDHSQLSDHAASDYLPWISDRFAGKPAPTTCH